MKLLTTFITLLMTVQLSFAEGNSSFKFLKSRTEATTIKVFFNLENEIDFEYLKQSLKGLSSIKSIEKSKEGYISLGLINQENNDEIRSVILSIGTDIDKKFIIISKKSYYNN